jgi:hypothetical protein
MGEKIVTDNSAHTRSWLCDGVNITIDCYPEN